MHGQGVSGGTAMARVDVQRILITAKTDLTLRSPPNWTAVLFFAALSSLHLFIAATAIMHHRWEAFMSVFFGVAFAVAAIACWLVRCGLTVMTEPRVLRVRTGTRRIFVERLIPFNQIRCVRLTLLNPRSPRSAMIELVCNQEVIECPSTEIPRQEALCLAVTIGTRLVKVYGSAFGPASERVDSLASS
jgi:hypothetical protein